jgi:hypothetical protein
MFSHHETKNIFEMRCVATIFWRSVVADYYRLVEQISSKEGVTNSVEGYFTDQVGRFF